MRNKFLSKDELDRRIKEIPPKEKTLSAVLSVIRKWEEEVIEKNKKIENSAKSSLIDVVCC